MSRLLLIQLLVVSMAGVATPTPDSVERVGTAWHWLEEGSAEGLSIVAIDFDEFGEGVAVVYNGTDDHVVLDEMQVVASMDDGSPYGVARSLMTASAMPWPIEPSFIGIVRLYFPGGGDYRDMPPLTYDAEFVDLSKQDQDNPQFLGVELTDVTLRDNRLVGWVNNTSDVVIQNAPTLAAVCFDSTGAIVDEDIGQTVSKMIDIGERVAFQLTVRGCETFLVTVKAAG
jgi:hypothetical protein